MTKKVKNQISKIKIYVSFIFLGLFLIPDPFPLIPAVNAEVPKRIISLAPGITEILFEAGLGDRVAGVTSFCDYPEEAKTKPKIGGMSNPSLEAVISLRPDIVIMTTDGNPKEFEQRLGKLKIKTHVFEALTMDELSDGIRKIGYALNETDRFDRLAQNIEHSIAEFRTLKTADRKKALFIIWPEPLIVAGPKTAVNDAMDMLGLINIAGQTKSRYPKYSIEEILRRAPDIIFIGSGKGMEKISGRLFKRLSNIPAVKDNRVFYVSDSLYRLGPRVINGIEELAGHLNEKKDSRGAQKIKNKR